MNNLLLIDSDLIVIGQLNEKRSHTFLRIAI